MEALFFQKSNQEKMKKYLFTHNFLKELNQLWLELTTRKQKRQYLWKDEESADLPRLKNLDTIWPELGISYYIQILNILRKSLWMY